MLQIWEDFFFRTYFALKLKDILWASIKNMAKVHYWLLPIFLMFVYKKKLDIQFFQPHKTILMFLLKIFLFELLGLIFNQVRNRVGCPFVSFHSSDCWIRVDFIRLLPRSKLLTIWKRSFGTNSLTLLTF